MSRQRAITVAVLILALSAAGVRAQVAQAPNRRAGDGEGPLQRLIIRGVTLIDGTGAPPQGPVDIVVEGNRIREIRGVGAPGLPIDAQRRPQGATKELDAHGMYVLPGLVDLHAHTGGGEQLRGNVPSTSTSSGSRMASPRSATRVRATAWTGRSTRGAQCRQQDRGAAYVRVHPPGTGLGWRCRELSRESAGVRAAGLPKRAWTVSSWLARPRADAPRCSMKRRSRDWALQAHLARPVWPASTSSRPRGWASPRWSTGTVCPKRSSTTAAIQDYPADYNYHDESHRFGQAGRLWKQAAAPGSDEVERSDGRFLKLDFVFSIRPSRSTRPPAT